MNTKNNTEEKKFAKRNYIKIFSRCDTKKV